MSPKSEVQSPKSKVRSRKSKVTHHDSRFTPLQLNVNLKGGWALIKTTWLMWLQHRSFFFLLAFGWMIPPLIYLFIWATAAGSGTIGGFSQGEFVAYYLTLILVNQFTYAQTNWTVGDAVSYTHLTLPTTPYV